MGGRRGGGAKGGSKPVGAPAEPGLFPADAVADGESPSFRIKIDPPRIAPGRPAAELAGEAPHYLGHRDRLRARFLEAGAGALADYELLELYLFRSIPQKDTKPLAKLLIDTFGGFAQVIGAPIERLTEVKGVGEKTAVDLKIIQAAAERAAKNRVLDRPVIASWGALIDYCRTALAEERTEQFRVLFLDRKNRLMADEVMGRGTIDHAPVYPREVMRRAIELGATAVILVHNHPSGDPTPSQADIEMTKRVIAAAQPLGITVHDHLVVGREMVASFRALELM